MAQRNESVVNFNFGSEYTTELLSALAKSLRLSANLHVGTDYRYQCTVDNFKTQSDQVSKRLEHLLNSVVDFSKRPTSKDKISYATTRTQRWRIASDATDNCLEKVDISLDLLRGYDRFAAPKGVSSIADQLTTKQHAAPGRTFGGSVIRDSTVKPQESFAEKIDNSNEIWKPKLQSKPNAHLPLEESIILVEPGDSPPGLLSTSLEQHIPKLIMSPSADIRPKYSHPYKAELENLKFTSAQLSYRAPIQPDDECECIWVDTEKQVLQLAEDLEMQKSFAVDLEHHGYRTYLGLTCLMQISTRARDYLVDSLELRDKLQPLLKAFTDPKIVKVFHGAYHDILWLQRDLGLYVVNLFDTYCASKVLEFPKSSFAYLLYHFCAVKTDKKYQLADWRIRPLPKGCLAYARMDTHYLLYIWDRMRNLLIEKAQEQKRPKTELVLKVLANSKQVSSQTYMKPVVSSDANVKFAAKAWPHKILTKTQHRVLQRLLEWRDREARTKDESARYILPIRVLTTLLEKLPKTKEGVMRYWKVSPQYCEAVRIEIKTAIENRVTDEEMSVSVSPSSFSSPSLLSTERDVEGMMPVQLGCLSSPLPGTPDWDKLNRVSQEDVVILDSQNASYSPLAVGILGKSSSNRPYTKNELCALGIRNEIRKGFRIGTLLQLNSLKRPVPEGSISSPKKKNRREELNELISLRERTRKRRASKLNTNAQVSKRRTFEQPVNNPASKIPMSIVDIRKKKITSGFSPTETSFDYSSTKFGDKAPTSSESNHYT